MGTLIQASSLGTSLPIVRYVYLVQDPADALRMGGNAGNTYTTFQTAYNAANALQLSLGGSNAVVIQVGNITAAAAGNLTLTANYNFRIQISGISRIESVLGDVIADNASGSAFSFGGNALQRIFISNVRLGAISTRATGATGNSGQVNLQLTDVTVGNISTNITNAANLTGAGGIVNITGATYIVGNILTNATPGVAVSAGNVTVTAIGTTGTIGNVTTANGNIGGTVNLSSIASGGTVTINQATTSIANVSLNNAILQGLNFSLTDNRTVNISGSNVGLVTIQNIGALVTPINVNITNSTISAYNQAGVTHAKLFMTNSICNGNMTSLSNTSQIYDSFIQGYIGDVQSETLSPYQAFKIKNCVIYADPTLGATASINNSLSGVYPNAYIESDNNVFNLGVKDVVLIENAPINISGGIGDLPGTPDFIWNPSIYSEAYLDISGGGATNYTLSWALATSFTLGKKFTLWIKSGSNTGTFTFTFLGSSVVFPGGTPWTPSAGATRLDRLEFQSDGAGIIMCTPILNYA